MFNEGEQVKISSKFTVNLKNKEVQAKVNSATKKSLLNVVVAIANTAIGGSPILTGNNRRSIKFEVGPGKPVAMRELEGAIYSTSGYGGYLETGTVNMAARPYFKPALDRHIKELPEGIKAELR